ncbi:MAG: hypothetical protein M1839_003999 [Geoglossum umbratile]|nr:MAG: hypothetical protein M1839_003999 [Geoglossum umbratile]
MLDCLTTWTLERIRSIRYIRVKAFPFPLYAYEDAISFTTYGFDNVLPMLPGLQLDRLVVEDCYHDGEGISDGWSDEGTYFAIQGLIESDGWKELHFISPSTRFMLPNDQNPRVRPPTCWNTLLQNRDGQDSGASVTMRISKAPKVPGVTENPDLCITYDKAPVVINDRDDTVDAYAKEVLVIANRGKNASYAQDGSTLAEEIRNLLRTTTWEEIKTSGLYVEAEEDPSAYL